MPYTLVRVTDCTLDNQPSKTTEVQGKCFALDLSVSPPTVKHFPSMEDVDFTPSTWDIGEKIIKISTDKMQATAEIFGEAPDNFTPPETEE